MDSVEVNFTPVSEEIFEGLDTSLPQPSEASFATKVGMRLVGIQADERAMLLRSWEAVPPSVRSQFQDQYGRILNLLNVEVQKWAVIALLAHWQPAFKVFSFKDLDLTPTLEEYSHILGCPLSQNSAIYSKVKPEVPYEQLARLIRAPIKESIRSQRRGLPSAFLLKHLQAHRAKEEWAPFMEATAMLIYGLILFPSSNGQVNEASLSIYLEVKERRINPVPAILAETFLQLDTCRGKHGLDLRASSTLLYIWVCSHLFIQDRADILQWHGSNTVEFKLPKYFSEHDWKEKYANLSSDNVRWRFNWAPRGPFIIMSGSLLCVPLLGVTGFTAYAPCLVMRQFGYPQQVPATRTLSKFQHTYGPEEDPNINRGLRAAWRSHFIYSDKSDITRAFEAASGYWEWFLERAKLIKKGPIIDKAIFSKRQLYDTELEAQALKSEIKGLEFQLTDSRRQYAIKADQTNTITSLQGKVDELEAALREEKRQHQLSKALLQVEIEYRDEQLRKRPPCIGRELTDLSLELYEAQEKNRRLEQANKLYQQERGTFLDIEMEMQDKIDSLQAKLHAQEQRKTSEGGPSKTRRCV